MIDASSYVRSRAWSTGTRTIAQPSGARIRRSSRTVGAVVVDVFEHVAADHGVERCVREVEASQVEGEIRAAGLEVGRPVVPLSARAKSPLERPLAREVQQRACALDQGRVRRQEQPDRAMALMRAAAPAHDVRAVPIVTGRA